jgi:hypothetical protein
MRIKFVLAGILVLAFAAGSFFLALQAPCDSRLTIGGTMLLRGCPLH